MIENLAGQFLVLLAQIVAIMAYALDGVVIVMSWLWYWHAADYIPSWFTGTLDAFLIVLVVRWIVRLIRLILAVIHDILDAIPVIG